MRWLKRKASNDARSVLRKAGYEFDRLPPVLVGNLELQKRGALHAHLALPYTTPLEMSFTRAFIDAMKRWARSADSVTCRAGRRLSVQRCSGTRRPSAT